MNPSTFTTFLGIGALVVILLGAIIWARSRFALLVLVFLLPPIALLRLYLPWIENDPNAAENIADFSAGEPGPLKFLSLSVHELLLLAVLALVGVVAMSIIFDRGLSAPFKPLRAVLIMVVLFVPVVLAMIGSGALLGPEATTDTGHHPPQEANQETLFGGPLQYLAFIGAVAFWAWTIRRVSSLDR